MSSVSAFELKEEFLKGERKVVDQAKELIDHHKKVDPKVQAFLSLNEEHILKQAQNLDSLSAQERKSKKLFGVPLAVKDNMCEVGVETTCASKILKGFVAPYDATVISQLKSDGALLFGRTNLDEFAMGSSTENSAIKQTHNPWDLQRIPGGSSGGSAAAVASSQVPLAIGSDTGGSIRQPASLCGVVGMKPTYGRVSRYGLVAFASSLDQIGPLAHDVRDCALLLQSLAGYDDKDTTSVNEPVPDYLEGLDKPIKGLKFGVPKEYFVEGMDKEVEQQVKESIKLLEDCGAKSESISLPNTPYAIATYYLVATAEASSNLARYDGVQYGMRASEPSNLVDLYFKTRSAGFGEEVKRRIMLGTYALSAGYYDAYYLKALKVRTLLKQDFENAFKKVDFIVTPTAPTPAFKAGEKLDDPLAMYLSDIFTISVNLAGIPGISIPCGSTQAGLPIGLQLIGKPFDEETLFHVGSQFQEKTDFHNKRPEIK